MSVIVRHGRCKSLNARGAEISCCRAETIFPGGRPACGTSIAPSNLGRGPARTPLRPIRHTKETGMNSRFLKLTAILAALMLGTACSATRTQRAAGEVVDDSVLTAKVKAALIEDPAT